MTATQSPTLHTAPFLVWPVTRAEFYRSIAIALLPTLAWAVIIFGWRVLGMFIGATIAATIAHWLLKRYTTRGKRLVFSHTLISAWVLVALAQPHWQIWTVSAVAFLLPAALWLVGGPGRERIHIAFLAVALLQLALIPLLQSDNLSDDKGAILARDRLVMGDIRDQTPNPLYQWPLSSEIHGNDAVAIARPTYVAVHTLDQLAHLLARKSLWQSGRLDPFAREQAEAILDSALGRLPNMELFLLGASPGRAGAVSFIGLICGGLYLAYRYILRSRSVWFFMIAYILASALFALWPALLAGGSSYFSPSAVWRIWSAFPAEIFTLLTYIVLNSDALFAAIIILALPGTEPLTARGRQVFLVAAAFLAAFLTRANIPLPTATFALCLLMPFAHKFDHHFAKRSWLNRLL